MPGKHSEKKKKNRSDIVMQLYESYKDQGLLFNYNQFYEIFTDFFRMIEKELLEGKEVVFRGIGIFTPTVKKATRVANPRNPDIIMDIPERPHLRFVPSRSLLEKMKAKQ